MTTTPNLGLTKDAETGELYSVARVNANSDRIDEFAGTVEGALVSLTSTVNGKTTKTAVYGAGTVITASSDLNDMIAVGNYYVASDAIASTLSNYPSGLSAGRVEVKGMGGDKLVQVVLTAAAIAAREYDGTAWGSWYKYEGTVIT